LFVAVWPPARVLDQIEALPRDEEGWRWTARAQWHVTVRFLGEADEEEAAAALRRVRAPAVEARLGPAVALLGRGVLMLPVEGLEELAGAVAEATGPVGRPPEDRPFRGHVTLGRWRARGRGRSALVGSEVAASFPVEELHLVRSTPGPGGSAYENVAAQPLAP
jgi:2'-5' RNA ligase